MTHGKHASLCRMCVRGLVLHASPRPLTPASWCHAPSACASFVAPWSGLSGANKLPAIYVTLSRVRTRTGLILSEPLPPLSFFDVDPDDPLHRFDRVCADVSDRQLQRLGLTPSAQTL